MKPPRPRAPRTTITALAAIVAVSVTMVGLRQAVETAAPSTVTIVDPQAPGDALATGDASVGADSVGSTTIPGSPAHPPPSRAPGGGLGFPTSPGLVGSGTGSGPGAETGSGAGTGDGSGTGGLGAGSGPTASPSGTSSAGAGAGPGSLIWNGKPTGGQSKFATLDCAKPGSLAIENDLQYGPIWVFDKPAGDDRCGAHGIAVDKTKYDFRDDSTYYIGWWSKFSDTADNNADFQWQSYGAGTTQGSPFEISASGGHATVVQRQPGSSGQTVWRSPTALAAGTWHHYVIGIHTSDALTGGWIQLWYDGKLQSFDNGATQFACRTWDVGNDPKWGEYGAQGNAAIDYVYAPKVGTSYASVVD
ncbi:MAG TPA: heparin lyase I family protein [Actinocrinis sp.]|nr:heparin lyase I family protein [Actinocrinis sp.]